MICPFRYQVGVYVGLNSVSNAFVNACADQAIADGIIGDVDMNIARVAIIDMNNEWSYHQTHGDMAVREVGEY